MATVNEFILTLDAIFCLLTVFVLGAYQRNGSTYCWRSSMCAWLLMVACGSVTILILTGVYNQSSLPETAINFAMLVAAWAAKGDVSELGVRRKDWRRHDDKRRNF